MGAQRFLIILIGLMCAMLLATAPVIAQSGNETCSSPGIIFGGETGTPVSISDSIQINDNLNIEDLHVRVDISHGFVADLLVDLNSPTGTTLRLHDGLGGDLDDLRVIFSDDGVANGAVTYDFGCYMQPSNGLLSVFSGQNTQGVWTLNVEDDFPANSDGVLNSWCLRFFNSPVSVLPAVQNFACTPTQDGAVLSWENPQPYGSIELTVNGTVLSLPGDTTTHTISGVAPGTLLEISVVGAVAPPGQSVSCAEVCAVTTLNGPPTQVAVTIDDGARRSLFVDADDFLRSEKKGVVVGYASVRLPYAWCN